MYHCSQIQSGFFDSSLTDKKLSYLLTTSPTHIAAKQYIPPVHPFLYTLVAESVSTGSHAAATDAAHTYGAEKVIVDGADLKDKVRFF